MKKKKIKYFQPVSSNMFGLSNEKYFSEKLNLSPGSIYALAKSSTFLAAKMYSKISNLIYIRQPFRNQSNIIAFI